MHGLIAPTCSVTSVMNRGFTIKYTSTKVESMKITTSSHSTTACCYRVEFEYLVLVKLLVLDHDDDRPATSTNKASYMYL